MAKDNSNNLRATADLTQPSFLQSVLNSHPGRPSSHLRQENDSNDSSSDGSESQAEAASNSRQEASSFAIPKRPKAAGQGRAKKTSKKVVLALKSGNVGQGGLLEAGKGQNGRKSGMAANENPAASDRTLENLSAVQVQCDVAVKSPMGPTTDAWSDFALSLSATTSMQELDRLVREALIRRLEEDEELLDQSRENNMLVEYKIRLLEGVCDEPSHEPTTACHAVETVSDLFIDPFEDGLILGIEVTIAWVERPTSNENQPNHSYELKIAEAQQKGAKGKRKGRKRKQKQKVADRPVLTAEDLVHERASLDTHADRHEYFYVRLGTVARPPATKPDQEQLRSSNDRVAAVGGVDAWLKQNGTPPFDVILLAYHFVGSEYAGKAENFKLITVEAWNFDQICIGDCVDHYVEHEFDASDQFSGEFQGVKSETELRGLVREYVRRHPNQPGRGVPFMPTFTCNTYSPQDHALRPTNKYADIVCRFVNHLEMGYEGPQPEHWLPFNVQYIVMADISPRKLKSWLKSVLKFHRDSPNTSARHRQIIAQMFQESRKDLWKLKLWVLPQGDGRKLYQYPTGDEDRGSGLSKFLDKDKVKERNKLAHALYMEAHIVLKDGSESEDESDSEEDEQEADRRGQGDDRSEQEENDPGEEEEETED